MVAAMLAEAGITVSELDAIAFGRGPGSFAGIRIATGVTQGLAYAADLPVLPISTLAAMALNAAENEAAEYVVAALDARMNEIYAAAYQVKGQQLQAVLNELVCAPEGLNLPEHDFLAVGSGFGYIEAMTEQVQSRVTVSEQRYYPSAANMLTLALQDWQAGKAVAAHEALPVYLRDEVAWKKKDQQ